MAQVLVNLGYVLMLMALTVRDILWLRGILIAAQLCLATYAFVIANHLVMFWQSLFVLLNSVQVVRILRERRPVSVPPDLWDLYEPIRPLMNQREFLEFWRMGTLHDCAGDVVIRKDEPQTELSMILSGTVVVVRDGRVVSEMSRGRFIAEMSFLTGSPASADVLAKGPVQYISWNQTRIARLKLTKPQLFIKIQGVLGRDLIEKIRVAPMA